jgi:hypothetical protein
MLFACRAYKIHGSFVIAREALALQRRGQLCDFQMQKKKSLGEAFQEKGGTEK